MTEYIKLKTVIDAVNKVYYDTPDINLSADKLKAALRSLPTIEIAPVRHGHWEDGNPICPVCGENKFKDLDADIWCDWKPEYCPNCGAKMDLEG